MRWSHVLVLALFVTAAGCAAGVQLASNDSQDPGLLLFNGYTKPDVKCFHCHNGDGRGSGKGPDLAPDVAKMPDAAILSVIDKGTAFMPGFGAKLNDQEQKQILAWLRDSFGGPATEELQAVEVEEVPTDESGDAPAEEPTEESSEAPADPPAEATPTE